MGRVHLMRTVAVTGIASSLGRKLLTLLEEDATVGKIVGVDCVPLGVESEKLVFHKTRDRSAGYDFFFAEQGVDTAVALGLEDAPGGVAERVDAFRRFINAAAFAKCGTVTLLSSILGYGARERGAEVIYEGTILEPNSDIGRAVQQMETLCYGYVQTFPTAMLQILRAALIVGPGCENVLTRALRRRVLIIPGTQDLAFQFVHEDDVARALHCVLLSESVGIFNLAADSALTIEQIAQLAEVRLLRWPESVLRVLTRLGSRLKISAPPWFPADAFTHAQRSVLVANMKLRHEAAFDFLYTGPEAFIESILPAEPVKNVEDAFSATGLSDEMPEEPVSASEATSQPTPEPT